MQVVDHAYHCVTRVGSELSTEGLRGIGRRSQAQQAGICRRMPIAMWLRGRKGS